MAQLGLYCTSIMKTTEVSELQNSSSPYDIVLTNAQKWRKADKNDPTSINYNDLPEDLFSLIIVDEAHHLPANQWREIWKPRRAIFHQLDDPDTENPDNEIPTTKSPTTKSRQRNPDNEIPTIYNH